MSRDLKHLSRYMDSREMQLRTELESEQTIDGILGANRKIEELYHQIIGQASTKLPHGFSAISDLIRRVAEGTRECFEMHEKNYAKLVASKDNIIKGLETELGRIKEEFQTFKENSTIEAYF